MAEGDKRERAALVKLVEELRITQARAHDLTEEIKRLLGGGEPLGEIMRTLEADYDRAWCGRYALGHLKRYVWDYAKDRAQMKRLLKSIDAVELSHRFARYVASDDAFYASKRHPFLLFVSSVNSWAARSEVSAFELEEGPIDCRHVPPCRSEVQHTKRRSAEARGGIVTCGFCTTGNCEYCQARKAGLK